MYVHVDEETYQAECERAQAAGEPVPARRSYFSKKAQAERERAASIEEMRKIAPMRDAKNGTTLYATVKQVSKSGMYRRIAIYAPVTNDDGTPGIRNISGIVADIIEAKWHDDDSVGVGGCGMDMEFHIVNTLSSIVWRGTPEAEAYKNAGGPSWMSRDAAYIYNKRSL